MTGGKDTHTNAHKRIRTQTLIAADRHHNAKAAGHCPAVSLSSTLSSKASLTVSFVGCLPTVPLYAGDVNKKSFEYYKIVFHNSLR